MQSRAKSLLKSLAILAVSSILVTVAVLANGFDERDIKLNSQNVWVLQTSQASGYAPRYGQVNTELGELSSANSVSAPDSIFQSAYGTLLFASSKQKFADINLSQPADFADDKAFTNSPADIASVDVSGHVVAAVSKKGAISVYKFVLPAEKKGTFLNLISEDKAKFSAIAVAEDESIFAFANTDSTIRRYDTANQEWTSLSDSVTGASAGEYQLSVIGSKWVLLNSTTGDLWIQGRADKISANPNQAADLKLQDSSPDGSIAYINTSSGLIAVDLGSGEVTNPRNAQVSGVPSQPVTFGGSVYAAWLTPGGTVGQLYSSANDTIVTLDFGGKRLLAKSQPVIQSNGEAAVLTDSETGWAWSLPSGDLVPTTQNWDLFKQKDGTGGEVENKNPPPRPPHATDDSFGARAGNLVSLPVLLNDYDANKDVLTIDPNSFKDFPKSQGTLRLSSNAQAFSLALAPNASSFTFHYKVTDGTETDGRLSNSASVRVTIVQPSKNTAPAWCTDVDPGCKKDWPSLQVAPGESVSANILEGFIDREGDRTFISSAEVAENKGSVGFTADGRLVYRSDASPGAPDENVQVSISVADVRGLTTTKTLNILVSAGLKLGFAPFVVTTTPNQGIVVDVRQGAIGVRGELLLQQAAAPANAKDAFVKIVGPTSFRVSSSVDEQLVIPITIADDAGTATSFVRVNVIKPALAKIAATPVTVLVSSNLDTKVDLFAAANNPSNRALVVGNISIVKAKGAKLVAEKIAGGFVRFRGRTATDTPGFIGTVQYSISDGTQDADYTATGQAFVYQMADESKRPIGVDDSLVLRAGAVGDVDVLSNDVGTPGVPLLIESESVITCKDAKFGKGLVFANHGVLRVVAPKAAGDYECSYNLYSAGNPTTKGQATLHVHVLSGGNDAPIAPTLFARLITKSKSLTIDVPLAGMDPNGDGVELVSVTKPGKGFASVNAKGNGIIYTASPDATGQDEFKYTVRDPLGATDTGLVKVGIFPNNESGVPVAMVDVVDLIAGSDGRAVIDPTANDFDPEGQALILAENSLRPDLPANSDANSLYQTMLGAIGKPKDGEKLSKNQLVFLATKESAVLRYTYKVKDSVGNSADGIILVRVAKKSSLEYPEIQDTYLDAKTRAELAQGVDVVTGKVAWQTGDVGKLTLSIFGDAQGYRVTNNWSITGGLPKKATVVVFKLSGKNYLNEDVESYGLLHIPAEQPLRLRDDMPTQSVKEGESLQINVSELVDKAAGDSIQVNSGAVTSAGWRDGGSCAYVSGTTVEYRAGNGKPWQDACIVEAKLAGAAKFTVLQIPITVIPANPQPDVSDRQITVTPGPDGRQEFDLSTMVDWAGHSVEDIQKLGFSISGQDSRFKTLSVSGSTLTIEIEGAVEPGQSIPLKVSVSNSSGKTGILTVLIGEAPVDRPDGGTLTFDCSANEGSCSLHVSDLQNSYSPKGAQLKFAPFGYSFGTPIYAAKTNVFAKCAGGVKLVVTNGDTITATWDKTKLPSANCSTTSQVIGYNDLTGPVKIYFNLKGAPGQVGAVSQTDYTSSSITLKISAKAAGEADPELQGYKLFIDGKETSASCELKVKGETETFCEISGLDAYNGSNPSAKHDVEVRPYNSVGTSQYFSKAMGVYAFDALPSINSVIRSAVTVLGDETSTSIGVAQIKINPVANKLIKGYQIKGDGGKTVTHLVSDFSDFQEFVTAKPGAEVAITVTAIAAAEPPVKRAQKEQTDVWRGVISGTPSLESVAVKTFGAGTNKAAKFTVNNVNRNYSERASSIAYVLWSGVEPTCTYTENKPIKVSGGIYSVQPDTTQTQIVDLTSIELSGLQANTNYKGKVCYSNGFKMIEKKAAKEISTIADPAAGLFKYAVKLDPNKFTWTVELAEGTAPAGVKVQFMGAKVETKDAWKDAIYSEYFGEEQKIRVRYVSLSDPNLYSDGTTLVQPVDTTKSWQLALTSGFLIDSSTDQEVVNKTCIPGRRSYKFGVVGKGVSAIEWVGGSPIGIQSSEYAEYFDGTWHTMSKRSESFGIPAEGDHGPISKMRFWFKPDSPYITGFPAVQVTIDVNC